MSTYEPGKTYLLDLDGETHQARYLANGINPGYFLTYAAAVIAAGKAQNVREAIVLDPEDKAVKRFAGFWGDPANKGVGTQFEVARAIAAQITPPEPPMEEPTELLERVTDDDGEWIRWTIRATTKRPWVLVNGDSIDSVFKKSWTEMVNPRQYEGDKA